MESPSKVKWLGIKPYLFRIFSGFLVLWSVNQVLYVVISRVTSVPTAAPEKLILVFPDQAPAYLTSLAFHCLAIGVFGIGAVIPSRTLMRVEEWWEIHRERPTWIAGVFLYLGFALAILFSFWLSITEPTKYLVFIDPDAGSVIKRRTHLLRPGVVQTATNFTDIKGVTLDIDPSFDGRGYYLDLVTIDNKTIEVGRLKVGRLFGDYTIRDLVQTGVNISSYSGAPFDFDEKLLN